jgi:hypothetical protein
VPHLLMLDGGIARRRFGLACNRGRALVGRIGSSADAMNRAERRILLFSASEAVLKA